MPISRSAKKSLRKANRNRGSNFSFKNKLKELIKKYLTKPTEAGLKDVQSVLDKSKKKNIYHKNKVARLKANMAKKLAKPETGEVKVTAKKKAVKKAPKKAAKRTAREKMSK